MEYKTISTAFFFFLPIYLNRAFVRLFFDFKKKRMLRLNKNYPKNCPVCYTCFVGKEFGFGVRWKLNIFGRETGKSKKISIYFENFFSQKESAAPSASFVEELVPCPGASRPSLCAHFSPFPFPPLIPSCFRGSLPSPSPLQLPWMLSPYKTSRNCF